MNLRAQLVATALAWQDRYGIAPSITSALSEYDAAISLLGMDEAEYGESLRAATAVQRGFDFRHEGLRYQIKANRPSGRPGSFVTKCPKASNYEWDHLIWILYNREYEIQEAWMWDTTSYQQAFHELARISPADMRRGKSLFPVTDHLRAKGYLPAASD